jgi:HNH endonuclease
VSQWPPPEPQAQVAFLLALQRLLTEGSFVATYKFALLHALADLALVKGDDSGAPLPLTTAEISGRMAELYWRQAAPYPGGAHRHEVLRHATGNQAAILNQLVAARQGAEGSLARFRRDPRAWGDLVRRVDRVVREMPLWKLQTVGTERLEFLYDNVAGGTSIRLKPGVAWCLRAYHGLVTELVRAAWLRFIRRHNPGLDAGGDLGTFLFGSERSDLTPLVPALREVQCGVCFYCEGMLRGESVAVDHFVPWSRYPMDLGHNFVLAHAGCNARKSDLLAAERHLERWVERNVRLGVQLAGAAGDAGIPADVEASFGVARWAYAQTERANGQVWARGSEMEHLSGAWRGLLEAS